jgi:5-hmdU DNA kinase, helical domain
MDISATSDDPIGRLVYWVLERERIRIAKKAGAPKPWTLDPILQANRFCNIRREDDPVTQWIAAWLAAHADDPNIWFAAAVARLSRPPWQCLIGRYHGTRRGSSRRWRNDKQA